VFRDSLSSLLSPGDNPGDEGSTVDLLELSAESLVERITAAAEEEEEVAESSEIKDICKASLKLSLSVITSSIRF
jgi:hypothetical protein